MIVYEFDIVGGEFDGAPGLKWGDDGKHPPPDRIFVGVCEKGMDCGTTACRRSAQHVSFWTPEEEGRPTVTQTYRKQDEFVVREGEELRGRAVYAIGGLLDPKNFGAKAKVPEGADPLVTALVPPATFAGGYSRAPIPAKSWEQVPPVTITFPFRTDEGRPWWLK